MKRSSFCCLYLHGTPRVLLMVRIAVLCLANSLSDVPAEKQEVINAEHRCEFKRIDMTEPGALEQFAALRKSDPVVLLNGIDGWPAFQTWSWEKLKARVDAVKLTSEDVHPGVLGDGWVTGMNISAILGAAKEKPRLLLLKHTSTIVQSLKSDFNVPSFLASVQRYGPQFSIGGKGQSAVFNDHQENWLAQVFGRKLWMVVPPTIFGVPPYADGNDPCQYLKLESELPEAQRRLSSCVIHPGEVISLPERWPHSTCNLDDYTVGVGYFGAVDNLLPAERAAVLGTWSELHSGEAASEGSAYMGHLLELSAEAGHIAVTQRLLDHRADASSVDAKKRSALHSAAKTGWPGVVEVLLEARAVMDAADKKGKTPLIEASYAGHLAVVAALCACKPGEEYADKCRPHKSCTNFSKSFESAAAGGHLPITQFFLQDGRQHDETSLTHMNIALAKTAGQGHSALVDYLLQQRADVDNRNHDGKPPLTWAARAGHLAAIQTLVMQGANITQMSLDGKNALIEAVRRRHASVAEFLLLQGVSVNTVDEQLRTPLHVAAGSGQLEMLELLLAARASVSAEDRQGHTAVEEAARLDYDGMLMTLLSAAGTEARTLAERALTLLDQSDNSQGKARPHPESQQVLYDFLHTRHEL